MTLRRGIALALAAAGPRRYAASVEGAVFESSDGGDHWDMRFSQ